MCTGLALAFHDGSIQILHRLSLHTMGVFYGSSGSSQRVGEEPAIKRQRTGGPTLHFKALQFSWTSLALVGVDTHGKVWSVMHNNNKEITCSSRLHIITSSFSPLASHDSSVSIYGADVRHEHATAAPPVSARVLHGNRVRLVGRVVACTAWHGP